MCYDISFSIKAEKLSDYLPNIHIDPQFSISFQPKLHVLAQQFAKYPIILFENGNYKLVEFEWGLIPNYMDTPEKIRKGRSFMCNAQSEKIIKDKSSVWHRLRGKRCLIPATGIFEHREVSTIKNKIPYHVKLKEREVFALPGLFNYSPIPDLETGEAIGTFTVITRAANSVMKQIHNHGNNAYRMPLFLPKELEQKWLLPDLTNEEIQEILDYEMPSEGLDYWPVFTIRSPKPRPDEKTKIDPFDWPNLPELGKENVEASKLF